MLALTWEHMPFVLFLFGAALASQSATGPSRDIETLEQEMHRLVNVEREARGIAKLAPLPPLANVARQHSRAMAEQNLVAHEIEGTPPFETRARSAMPNACHFGENITKHYTVEYALADLMGSPGHRGNILDPKYTFLGIGIVRTKEGLLFITQDFIALCRDKVKASKTKQKE